MFASYWSDAGVNSWVYNNYGTYQAFWLPAGTGLPMDNYYSNPYGALYMQTDGNLVLYQNGAPLWGANWSPSNGYVPIQNCPGCVATMQWDGNLVLYNPGGAYWASNTYGYAGNRLLLYKTTPVIMVSTYYGAELWSSLSEPVGYVRTLNDQIRGGGNLLDFLISDVCVDAFDHPIDGDPAYCSRRRNLRIGEKIPYLVTDFDTRNNYITYSAMASMPVPGADGRLKVMAVKNLQTNFNSSFAFSFVPSRDGFDLVDVFSSSYVSFIRTSDGGCYDQAWSSDGSFQNRSGGWILFPAYDPFAFPGSTSVNMTTHNISLSGVCSGGHSQGTTYWNYPYYYTFETGKTLAAVKSYHFASSNLSSSGNALEMYYFTREYGFTRWEAWVPQSRCYSAYGSGDPRCNPTSSNNFLSGRCWSLNVSATGNPAMDTWGGQTWVRVDCRDHTNYISLYTPSPMLDTAMAQNNGVVDITTEWLYRLW
ncbi:MAG: hypothetical protein AB7G93_03345 [Bdellovibrionales bacterium]